jgi:hypothetical protein
MSPLDSIGNTAANMSYSATAAKTSGSVAALHFSSTAGIGAPSATTGQASVVIPPSGGHLSGNTNSLHAPSVGGFTPPSSSSFIAGAVNGPALVPRSGSSAARDVVGNQPGAFNLLTGASSIMGLRESQLAPVSPGATSVGEQADATAAVFGQGQGERDEAQQAAFWQADPQKPVPEIFASQSGNENREQTAEGEEVAAQQDAAAQQREKRAEAEALANQQIIKELERRDAEVKAHEQAHAATGGQYAGSASFRYERGPDGRRYATDGEVQIDLGTVTGDPLATMNKMKQVYAAAMAPANPSQADIRVAAEALQKLNEAKAQLTEERLQSAVKPEELEPLLAAEALLKGFPELPEPEFGVKGEVDEAGHIARPQKEIANPVQDTLEPIIRAFGDGKEPSAITEQTEPELATATLEIAQESQALIHFLGGYYENKPASTSSLDLAV